MGKDTTEQANSGDKLARFLQKHRKALLTMVIIIAAGIVFSAAFFIIRGIMEKNAIAKVENYERRINEMGAIDENTDPKEADALLEELNSFAESTFGYAAARAYALAADIYFSRTNWKRAEESWVASARKAPTIYLYPLSLYNAAVAAEEQGKKEEAINYLKQSLDYPDIYAAAAKARFNIGRIHEELHDKEKAAEAYRELIAKNPDSQFANLAHNRLIILEKN
jgi:tetratricopeptide (TPR) repeat protein